VENESFNPKPQAPAVSPCSLLAKQPSPPEALEKWLGWSG
jgi:hypothetical protein